MDYLSAGMILDSESISLVTNNDISADNDYNNGSTVLAFCNDLNIMLDNNSIYESLEKTIKIAFNTTKIDYIDLYEPLIINYNLAKKYAFESDYKKSFKHIKICIKLIEEKNYSFNLNHIYNLLFKMNRYIVDKEVNEKISKMHNDFFNSNNNGLNYYYLNNILKLEPDNINYIILFVEELIILGDYKKARKYLSKVINCDNSRVHYLDYKIKNLLSKKNHTSIATYKAELNVLIYNKEFNNALNLCEYAFNKTDDPYFVYYFGKICIDNDIDYSKGLDIIKKCLSLSDCYIRECYAYILYALHKMDTNEDLECYSSLLYELYKFENISVDIKQFENIVLEYIDDYNESSVLEISKKMLHKSEVKQKKYIY